MEFFSLLVYYHHAFLSRFFDLHFLLKRKRSASAIFGILFATTNQFILLYFPGTAIDRIGRYDSLILPNAAGRSQFEPKSQNRQWRQGATRLHQVGPRTTCRPRRSAPLW